MLQLWDFQCCPIYIQENDIDRTTTQGLKLKEISVGTIEERQNFSANIKRNS